MFYLGLNILITDICKTAALIKALCRLVSWDKIKAYAFISSLL